ncbi:probable serine/threonine-protein kinase drkB [Coccomyxa sp. Obi]|nr:probable serine/threonine-protein kinase drkB [Coccomyxa sp. Obi]
MASGTVTFCPLSKAAKQMHNNRTNSKAETEIIAQLLPRDAFLDMSEFHVFLEDNNLVESSQGPFGQVWKAKWADQTVGLKVAYFDAFTARTFSRDMTGLLRSERHPCVLQLHGVVSTGWDILLVLEHAPGPSLVQAIHSSKMIKRVSWRGLSGRTIAVDIASGLRHLHGCDVILRDVNPTLTEGLKHAKLPGFNLDLIRRRPASRSSVSVFPGHLPYPCEEWRAPEVRARHRVNICAKADVFSIGAILFEMVMQESADIHMQGIKPQVRRQCSQEVFDLIEACMAVDPNARPTSEHVFNVLSSMASAA